MPCPTLSDMSVSTPPDDALRSTLIATTRAKPKALAEQRLQRSLSCATYLATRRRASSVAATP
eukprot:5708780-Pleurochrysis_carterae.AAC.2